MRHRAKVPFEPIIDVPDDFIDRSSKILMLDQEMDSFILGAEDLRDLLIDSFSSNVHRTTGLEGNPLSEDEVRRITRMTFLGDMGLMESRGAMKEVINHLRIPWSESELRPP